MRIAILGGSFDPPHFGHMLIAQQVLEFAKVDQVWLMPNFTTSTHHKVFRKRLSSPVDRLAMVKLLESKHIKASDFEMEHNQKSLTITTLETLTKQNPQHEFYWITGSDKLVTFYLYDDWKDIVLKHRLIIFPRGQALKDLEKLIKHSLHLKTIPKNVIVLHNKELIVTNISSTIVRERIKKGLSVNFLVPPAVEKYIKKNKLYE
jgi:nicotinate-nucleotide adenylyltransferase